MRASPRCNGSLGEVSRKKLSSGLLPGAPPLPFSVHLFCFEHEVLDGNLNFVSWFLAVGAW